MINKRQRKNRRFLIRSAIISFLLELILGIALCGYVEGGRLPLFITLLYVLNFAYFMIVAKIDEVYDLRIN